LFLLILSISVGYILQFTILKDEFPIMIPNFNKFLPLYLSLFGSILSIYLGIKLHNWWKLGLSSTFMKIYSFTNMAWYFDVFFNNYVVKPVMKVGFFITYKLIDNQILETLGPTKVTDNIYQESNLLSKFHSGKISVYTFIFIIFIFCFIFKF
jgi:NADH:ubiquinone oxidoreductase subunit 5 (subunit L)/multisubunit Na+/H+ antiporter MnhA subunit